MLQFVFPIWYQEHYFVIAINVKTPRFDILDNSTVCYNIKQKYDHIPDDMVSYSKYCLLVIKYFFKHSTYSLHFVVQRYLFTEFLKKHNMESKAAPFLGDLAFPTRRLDMSWRDGDNHKDCGVYVMRHMETYFDNGLNGWKTDLKTGKEGLEQLDMMRIKYCAAILESPWNEHRSSL